MNTPNAEIIVLLVCLGCLVAYLVHLVCHVATLRAKVELYEALQLATESSLKTAIARAERAEAGFATERARLDSGRILLTVSGERVWYSGVDLRAAIDAGMREDAK